MADTKEPPSYSEPAYAKSLDRAKFPFYSPNIESKLIPETRELLEKYSCVPREQQSVHIHKIRDQAWDIRAYPCTGLGTWVVPQLCKSPAYSEVLARVKSGQILVDVGCFIGHDLRRLVYDGAPSENLYGVDIVSHWNVGFNMFQDQGRFNAHFIEADILFTVGSALTALKGKVDIISVTQVIHSWDWAGQVKAAKALTTFTKPGSTVVGNQIGNPTAQEVKLNDLAVPMWRHNPASWEKMWAEVSEETGTKWEAQAWMRTFEDMWWEAKDGAWMEPGVGIIEFVVKRTA